MKAEISGNVVEVRRKSDRVMAIVITLNREVIRIICAYGPQCGGPNTEKVCFCSLDTEKRRLSGTWEVLVKSSFLGGFRWTRGEMC